MRKFFERLDTLAGIDKKPKTVQWLERFAFIFLVLTFISAPHSIAATQTAWIVGMTAWVVRLFFKPGVRFRLGWLDAALWGLFIWSAISSLVSYEPAVSINKLRGVAVFLIFYFVIYNVRTRKAAFFLAAVMIGSCLVNVVWMPIERIMGRGVEVNGLTPDGALAKARLLDGDTLLEVNGQKVWTPDGVLAEVEQAELSKVKFYRPDFEFTVELNRDDLVAGNGALARLGASDWKKSHNWRSKGFFGHYTTYAEVLQLIGSLALGLFAALTAVWIRRKELPEGGQKASGPSILLLIFAVGGIALALLLTVTRAPQLAFVISSGLILLFALGRRWFLTAILVLVPIAIGGLVFLQQSRNVDFFDGKDESSRYRQMMIRDGLRLASEDPRHIVFGVGMDSIQKHWQEWNLYDKGWQPMGHFHSTPVQLLVERGLPALLLWIAVIAIYAVTLLRSSAAVSAGEWRVKGILLGCLGGLAGFITSGLVHYNLGDQEVAMVFFMLMGLGVCLSSKRGEGPDGRQDAQASVRLAA